MALRGDWRPPSSSAISPAIPAAAATGREAVLRVERRRALSTRRDLIMVEVPRPRGVEPRESPESLAPRITGWVPSQVQELLAKAGFHATGLAACPHPRAHTATAATDGRVAYCLTVASAATDGRTASPAAAAIATDGRAVSRAAATTATDGRAAEAVESARVEQAYTDDAEIISAPESSSDQVPLTMPESDLPSMPSLEASPLFSHGPTTSALPITPQPVPQGPPAPAPLETKNVADLSDDAWNRKVESAEKVLKDLLSRRRIIGSCG